MKKATFYLMVLLATMMLSMGVKAQTGLTPLLNSTHTYTVTPGNGGNTFAWSIVEGVSGTDYTLTGASGLTATVIWKKTGTYTLQFRETAATTGCITLISKSITVSANTFDVTTPSTLAGICNAASGVANYSTTSVATTVQFVITMATGVSTFNPNWEFNFTLTPGSGATIGTVSTSAGTLSGTGPYTVTAVPSSGGTGTVTISFPLTTNINIVNTAAILITSAKELTYQTPSNNTGNKAATQTVNAIPATTGFSSN
jgi:hypothetical protein